MLNKDSIKKTTSTLSSIRLSLDLYLKTDLSSSRYGLKISYNKKNTEYVHWDEVNELSLN